MPVPQLEARNVEEEDENGIQSPFCCPSPTGGRFAKVNLSTLHRLGQTIFWFISSFFFLSIVVPKSARRFQQALNTPKCKRRLTRIKVYVLHRVNHGATEAWRLLEKVYFETPASPRNSYQNTGYAARKHSKTRMI